jgi:hypothetical protein
MTFQDRVAEVQRRIVDLQPSLADIAPDLSHSDAAVWRNGIYHATLSYHPDRPVPSLSLILLAGDHEHPDAMDIGIDEADVVEMIAQPIAALLSGAAA